MDGKAREHELLDRENRQVVQDLEEYKLKESKYQQVRISLEEETQRRVNSDAEADRLRF